MNPEQNILFGSFKTPQMPQEGLKSSILGPNPMPMGIQTKETVRFKVLRPEIYQLFPILSEIFHARGKECVITSANDSVHKQDSKHYHDLALDLRSKHLLDQMQKDSIFQELKDKLGPKYLVLFENQGKDAEHFHIGYQG